MGDHVSVQVECYSGFEYAERPVAVLWEGETMVVEKIVDQWHTPSGRGFRVRLQDGRSCLLTYSAPSDEWTAAWVAESPSTDQQGDKHPSTPG